MRYLSERDSLGIVEYGSDVRVCAPLTLCDQGGRDRLKAAVEKIETSGQTNLSGGLLKGLELHRARALGWSRHEVLGLRLERCCSEGFGL